MSATRLATIQREKGYVTLVSVLIVGTIGIATALSLILLGAGSSRTSFALEQSNQAKALANACAEGALEAVRNSPSFSGTGGFSLGQGACAYTVINLGGQSKRIESSGTVGSIIRKVKITLDQITPKIRITFWQEVGDF